MAKGVKRGMGMVWTMKIRMIDILDHQGNRVMLISSTGWLST